MLSSPDAQAKLASVEAAAEVVVTRARRAKVIKPGLKAGDFRRLVCGLERAVRAGGDANTSANRYVDIVLAGLKA